MILDDNIYMERIKANYNFSGIYYIRKQILQFRADNEIISDDDILSLFMGIVRLIKNSCEIKAEEKYISIINSLKSKSANKNKGTKL